MSYSHEPHPGTPNYGSVPGSSYSTDQPHKSLAAPPPHVLLAAPPPAAGPGVGTGAAAAAAAAPAKSKKKLWIILGVVAAVAILGGIGAGVGIAVSNNNKKSTAVSTGDGSSSGSNTDGGNSGNNSTDPPTGEPDYSKFERDPNLKRSLWAVAYTSDKGLYPECGVTLQEVIRDVQLLSQLTNVVRIYGGNCGLPDLLLEAITRTKVDLKVYLGNYIQVANDDSYQRQKVAIEEALKKHGADNVLGVTVGNEVMLNYCLDQGTTDANSAIVKPASDYIISCIQDTRTSLAALGFGDIKVGNSDAGSYFSTAVLEVADYGLSNVHPWFAHQTAERSVQWTWFFFQENNVEPASLLPNKPEMFLAETGWPTGSKWTNTSNSGAGVGGEASVANLQIFLDNFVCQSNQQGIKYFYFELFDQIWKDEIYGGVEGYWGLLDSNRQLKPGITLPSCTF